MVELTQKQPLKIRVKNDQYSFSKPYFFFKGNDFENPIKPVVKGSQLAWNISGETITYNQLKKSINESS